MENVLVRVELGFDSCSEMYFPLRNLEAIMPGKDGKCKIKVVGFDNPFTIEESYENFTDRIKILMRREGKHDSP